MGLNMQTPCRWTAAGLHLPWIMVFLGVFVFSVQVCRGLRSRGAAPRPDRGKLAFVRRSGDVVCSGLFSELPSVMGKRVIWLCSQWSQSVVSLLTWALIGVRLGPVRGSFRIPVVCEIRPLAVSPLSPPSTLMGVTWSSCWTVKSTCPGLSGWTCPWILREGCSTCTARASSTGISLPRSGAFFSVKPPLNVFGITSWIVLS